MSDTDYLLVALGVTTLGMASFALSIAAHWKQIFPHRSSSAPTRIALRAAGASLLAAAFVICALADPFMMAVLVWPMMLLVGAGLVSAVLTIHAQLQRVVTTAAKQRR